MKFDDLYNRVFVSEQENTEVAHPDDFNDVDPAPMPEPMADETPALAPQGDSNLSSFMSQLEDFANKLNSPDGSSLQTLVSKLDRPETPFEGLKNRTSADIEVAAKTLRTISEKFKTFIINAAKNNS